MLCELKNSFQLWTLDIRLPWLLKCPLWWNDAVILFLRSIKMISYASIFEKAFEEDGRATNYPRERSGKSISRGCVTVAGNFRNPIRHRSCSEHLKPIGNLVVFLINGKNANMKFPKTKSFFLNSQRNSGNYFICARAYRWLAYQNISIALGKLQYKAK